MTTIAWFNNITKENVATVGGKGASLGEMYNAGMPIPPGFCVTAQAYAAFLKANTLHDTIAKLLKGLDVEETAKLDTVAEKIQEKILNGTIPKEMSIKIAQAYGELDGFVAVRSSATAEDLPQASFAGQQATFLNIKGKEAVVQHVKECWASLFTPRAIYYRAKNNFDHMQVLIAVVVQTMVNAKKAGVMFSVNPVTNDDKEMIIEGSFGLGEAVVGGEVSPDTYIIGKDPLRIKQKHIGIKEFGYFKTTEGKTEKIFFDEAMKNQQVLEDHEIIALAERGIHIEKYYEFPQDIEWAIDDKVYILQARPVTTFKKG